MGWLVPSPDEELQETLANAPLLADTPEKTQANLTRMREYAAREFGVDPKDKKFNQLVDLTVRRQAARDEGMGPVTRFARNSGSAINPVKSLAQGTALGDLLGRDPQTKLREARERYDRGEASNDDLNILAREENWSDIEANRSVAGKAGDLAMAVPNMVAETVAGTRLLRGAVGLGVVGRAGLAGRTAQAAVLGDRATFAGKAAQAGLSGGLATPVIPSSYLPEAYQQANAEGRQVTLSDLPAPAAKAAVQNAVVGQLGGTPGGPLSGLGFGVKRLGGAVALGTGEQLASDVGLSAFDDAVKAATDKSLGVTTKYGPLAELARSGGRSKDAWAQLLVQTATFAAFGSVAGLGSKVPDATGKAIDGLRAEGHSADESVKRLTEMNRAFADAVFADRGPEAEAARAADAEKRQASRVSDINAAFDAAVAGRGDKPIWQSKGKADAIEAWEGYWSKVKKSSPLKTYALELARDARENLERAETKRAAESSMAAWRNTTDDPTAPTPVRNSAPQIPADAPPSTDPAVVARNKTLAGMGIPFQGESGRTNSTPNRTGSQPGRSPGTSDPGANGGVSDSPTVRNSAPVADTTKPPKAGETVIVNDGDGAGGQVVGRLLSTEADGNVRVETPDGPKTFDPKTVQRAAGQVEDAPTPVDRKGKGERVTAERQSFVKDLFTPEQRRVFEGWLGDRGLTDRELAAAKAVYLDGLTETAATESLGLAKDKSRSTHVQNLLAAVREKTGLPDHQEFRTRAADVQRADTAVGAADKEVGAVSVAEVKSDKDAKAASGTQGMEGIDPVTGENAFRTEGDRKLDKLTADYLKSRERLAAKKGSEKDIAKLDREYADATKNLYAVVFPIPPAILNAINGQFPWVFRFGRKSPTPALSTDAHPIPLLDAHNKIEDMAGSARGLARFPLLNVIFGDFRGAGDARTRNVTKAVTGWQYVRNVGRGVRALWAARGAEFRTSPFKYDPATRQVELANGTKGYLGDVVEAELARPGSQPLTPPQQKFVTLVRAVNAGIKRLADAEGIRLLDPNGNPIDMLTYFPREVTARDGQVVDITTPDTAGGRRPGVGQTFDKTRTYRTEADGVKAGLQYNPDALDVLTGYIEKMYAKVADKRLVESNRFAGRRLKPGESPKLGVEARMSDLGGWSEDMVYDARTRRLVADALAPEGEGPGRLDRTLQAVRNVKMSGDVSFIGTQLLATAFTAPRKAFAPGVYNGLKDAMTNSNFLAEKVAADPAFADRVNRAVQLGMSLRTLADAQAGGVISKAVDKLPGLGWAIRASTRGMSSAIDAAKLGLFEAWEHATPPEKLGELVQDIETITLSGGRGEQLGQSRWRRTGERLLLSAPSFQRSGANFIARAVQDWHRPTSVADAAHQVLRGNRVRQAAIQTAGGITLLAVGAMKAAGLSDDEVKERLDPRTGKFLTLPMGRVGQALGVEMPNVSVGFAGPVIGWLRLAGELKEAAEKSDPSNPSDVYDRQLQALSKWMRGKTNPAGAGLMADLLSGKNFDGEKITVAGEVRQAAVPVPLANLVEDYGQGKSAGQIAYSQAFSAFGAKAFPGRDNEPYLEQVDQFSRKFFDKPMAELTIPQRANVMRRMKNAGVEDPGRKRTAAGDERVAELERDAIARVEKGLVPASKGVLDAVGHRLPGVPRTLPDGEVRVMLTDGEYDRLEGLVVEQYNNNLSRIDPRNYSKAGLVRAVDARLEDARKRALGMFKAGRSPAVKTPEPGAVVETIGVPGFSAAR